MSVRVEIRSTGTRATVLLDGEPVRGVCAYKVEQCVNGAALVTLTYLACEVTLIADDAELADGSPT